MSTKSNTLIWTVGVVLSLLAVPVAAQFGATDDGFGGAAEGFEDDFGDAAGGFEDGGDIGPMAVPRPKPDGTVQLHLKDGSIVVGKLASEKPIKLKSAFGDVAIPSLKIASLQFGEDLKSTRITLRNGDRVTGQLHLEKIEVKAVWGEVAIKTEHLLGIVSKDLAQGYQRVRRAVVERGDDGERVVRYIEELVPMDHGAGWYPGDYGAGYADPGGPAFSVPGGYAPASVPGGGYAPAFDAAEDFDDPIIEIDAAPVELVPSLPDE